MTSSEVVVNKVARTLTDGMFALALTWVVLPYGLAVAELPRCAIVHGAFLQVVLLVHKSGLQPQRCHVALADFIDVKANTETRTGRHLN